jgi:hypothetical protein
LVVPLALSVAYALWTFWPDRSRIAGWGEDPYFNVWTLELCFRKLDASGPFHIWDRAFWSAPIFAGSPFGLACSENQIYLAVLLWPLWHLTGNATFAMTIGAAAMIVLAWVCATGWLRSLGFTDLAPWGGLAFAGCGWLQSQLAHYQNVCIFLLPLALWSFERFARKPGPGLLAICALLFGWICGFNLYYQLFANALLPGFCAVRRRAIGWPRLGALVALTALVEAPILEKYLALERLRGSFSAAVSYGAVPWSFLGSSHRPGLLYRRIEVPIEAAGFCGAIFAALLVVALFRPGTRGWAAFALCAYWTAHGLGTGLFDVVHLVPGFGALRAAGRFQILVVLLGIPAALGVLGSVRPGLRAALLAAMLLELVPRGPPESVPVSPDAGKRIEGVPAGPVLVFPRTDSLLQLYSLDAGMELVEGQSGVGPANAALLRRRIEAGGPGHATLEEVLRFARPPVVAAPEARWIAFLSGSPLVAARGCRDLHGIALCFFEPLPLPPEPLLRLDRDGTWDLHQTQDGRPIAALLAKRAGVLDYAALGRCTTREQLKFPALPAFARRTYLRGLEAPLLRAGDPMLVREWRQSIFRLPGPLRPALRISVLCAG